LLLGAYLAPFVNPRHLTGLGLLAIGYPFLLLANLVFMGFWLLHRHRRRAAFPALCLLLGAETFLHHFGIHPPSASTDGALRVLTMNANYFDSLVLKGTEENQDLEKIRQFLSTQKPDIFCGQDFSGDGNIDKLIFETLGSCGLRDSRMGGPSTMVFSRYPVLAKDSVLFTGGRNGYGWVDIQHPQGVFRVYNLHLYSYQLGQLAREKRLPLQVGQLLLEGIRERSDQARLVAESIARCPYPLILCGDFNDVPLSYAYHTIAAGLKDTFAEAGWGPAITFKALPFLRIDYILCSPGWHARNYQIPWTPFSDHNPAVCELSR